MNGIIAWFARNGVAANLLMMAILGGGIWAGYNKIILQEYPEYPSREIRVSVSYRGSTPGEIEQAADGPVRKCIERLVGDALIARVKDG
jgi:multidrug efflux pump subunit AcrB